MCGKLNLQQIEHEFLRATRVKRLILSQSPLNWGVFNVHMRADDLMIRKNCACRENTCKFLQIRELPIQQPMKRLICVAETQNVDAVHVFISVPQAVMSRALSAMGRASGTARCAQTPPLCSEMGSASASAARDSTARSESATVKKPKKPSASLFALD